MIRHFSAWTTLAANVVLVLCIIAFTGAIEFRIFGESLPYPHKLFYDLRAVLLAVMIGLIGLTVYRKRSVEICQIRDRCSIITESMDEGLIEATRTGKIVSANAAARTMFMLKSLEGVEIEDLMPEQFRARHHRGIVRYLSTGKTKIVGKLVLLTGLRSTGEEFPISICIRTYGEGSSLRFFALIRDLSTSFIVDVGDAKVPEIPDGDPSPPKQIPKPPRIL